MAKSTLWTTGAVSTGSKTKRKRRVQGRELLSGQHQQRRAVRPRDSRPPGPGRLVGVARSNDIEVRNGSQGGDVLDGLVCRSVLAETDRVVGHYVDDRELHERCQPNRGTSVVCEHEEGRSVWPDTPMQRQTVADPAHAELAHAVAEVPEFSDKQGEIGGTVDGADDDILSAVVLAAGVPPPVGPDGLRFFAKSL